MGSTRRKKAKTARNKGLVLNGDGEVSIEYLPLSKVEHWPRNPKEHDIPSITASLVRFGFVTPLVRDTVTERLVAGHGRLEALVRLKESGADPPKRIKVDSAGEWYVPVLSGVGFDDEGEAEAYLLADNRLTTIGGYDAKALADMLADMDNAGVDVFTGLGFDEASLRDTIASSMNLDDFFKPEVTDADGKSTGQAGINANTKDGSWFYGEFYQQDERFNRLHGALIEIGAMHKNGRHEIAAEHLEAMIEMYVAAKRVEAAGDKA